MSRPYFAPTGVDQSRLVLLREGIKRTWKDQSFLAEAKRMNIDIEPVEASTVEGVMKRFADAPSDLIEKARVAMQ